MKTGHRVTEPAITSHSIKQITRRAAYAAPSTPPPSIKKIFNSKSKRASILVDFQKAARPEYGKKHPVRDRDIHAANKALNDIPEGFRLEPIVYTRVSKDQNKIVYNEFRDFVRPRFMRFLANYYADDLKTLGICDYGIKRMSQGIDPCDSDGRLYDISVDHIIERAGSGKMAYTKAEDQKLQGMCEFEDFKPTYWVNHFDNLMLLPNQIHFDRKNAINDIQQMHRGLKEHESVWGVMMAPVRTKNAGEYIYRPMANRMDEYGVQKRKMTFETHVHHTFYLSQQLDEALNGFNDDPHIKKTYHLLHQIASDNNARLSQYWEQVDIGRKQSAQLRHLFHASLATCDKDQKDEYKRILGLSDEIYRNLKRAVEKLEAVPEDKRDDQYWVRVEKLEKIYTGPLKMLLPRLHNTPAQNDGSAAKIVLRMDDQIQKLIQSRQISRAKNDNDISPPAKKRNNYKR